MSEATHSIKLVHVCIRDQATGRVRLAVFAIKELTIVLITAPVDALVEAACTFATAFDVEHYLHAWSETIRQASQSADQQPWVDHKITLWPVPALEQHMVEWNVTVLQAAQSASHLCPEKGK